MSPSIALAGDPQVVSLKVTAKVAKTPKALDPRDDVSGEEFNEGLEFFARWGYRALQRAMLKQTVDDVINVRQNRHAPPDVHVSASWAKTARGHAAIEFLMPGVSADVIVSKLYEDPEKFLAMMSGADMGAEAEVTPTNDAVVRLDSFVAAEVFGEKPQVDEDDQPLSLGQSHFDEFPPEDSSSDNAPGPSWG